MTSSTITKKDFSFFLNDKPSDYLYFAAHSHHPWPDCSYDAHLKYWHDSANMINDKWSYVFGTLIPELQLKIAEFLNLGTKGQSICFAPNTHEFVVRLLSNLPTDKTPHILTTDSEFYSFDRQINRMVEASQIKVTKIPLHPIASFTERLLGAAQNGAFDMIFFSHVFFNAGYRIEDLTQCVSALRLSQQPETPIIIDGYHAFMARPVDLSEIKDQAFYLAGGYKYAMSGEGCCFMHCPDNMIPRPVNTGWFAAYDHLSDMHNVPYHAADNGMRFMGATFDPSGLYRMHAVLHWLSKNNMGPNEMDAHILPLMSHFTQKALEQVPWLTQDMLIINPAINHNHHGHFIAIEKENVEHIHDQLKDQNVICDYRGHILRFGFGIYHDIEDVDQLIAQLRQCKG